MAIQIETIIHLLKFESKLILIFGDFFWKTLLLFLRINPYNFNMVINKKTSGFEKQEESSELGKTSGRKEDISLLLCQ